MTEMNRAATGAPVGKIQRRWATRMSVVLMALVLSACAATIKSEPAVLAASPSTTTHEFTLKQRVPVTLHTAYTRTIPDGSRWRESGRLPQGVVYRPLNTVFAIEGRDVHEAYLVVADGVLVGFYLPGEARFSRLDTTIRLPTGETQ
ncbi:MAG: hypothetical protein RLZZ618_552 [Pseudomonadota bacterium]